MGVEDRVQDDYRLSDDVLGRYFQLLQERRLYFLRDRRFSRRSDGPTDGASGRTRQKRLVREMADVALVKRVKLCTEISFDCVWR